MLGAVGGRKMKPTDDRNLGESSGGVDESVPVDAAFLGIILEADLENIIRKAQSGKSLTAREREILESERARLAEVESPPDLKLDDEAELVALEGMTQKDLAELWGYSEKQLKNWVRRGRESDDPAPIRRPDLMCAWFRRVHAPRDAPEKLRMAAQRIIDGHRKPEKSKSGDQAPVERIEIAESEKGMLAMLDRYRTAEVTLHNKYMAAVEAGDETRAQFLLSEWSKMGEKVRALEKHAPKVLEELKIYVRRDEIQRELESLHSAIIKAFRQEFRLARIALKATTGTEEWAKEIDATVDRVALMLAETEFRDPLELQVA
jgi:hypothetical protein